MRIRIVGNWSILRILRLVVGISGTVQGFILKEFALSLAAFWLVYMALADVGPCNSCEVDLKGANQGSKEMKGEMVDRLL